MEKENINPLVMQEAERWFGRLGRDAFSAEDRRAFEHWRAHAEHAAAYREVERVWARFESLEGHPDLDHLMAQVGQDRRAPWTGVTWALAASVTVFVLALVFLAGQQYVPGKTYTTEFGQRSVVELEDGSQVILNSDTRLKVRFAADRREISLKRGEALFTVARDPARPLTVTARDGKVTALGTRFQVRSERNEFIVTLLEGKVAVDREGTKEHLQLKPGDQVKFVADTEPVDQRRVNPDLVSSWTSGRLQFEDTPLAEVLTEVNRYSKTQLRLADPSLDAMPINGVFDIGNSASVVSALEALLPVEATVRVPNQIILTRRRE